MYVSRVGIRELLRAYKLIILNGRSMEIVNVTPQLLEVFKLTGSSQFMPIKSKIREISIDSLELLSAGVCGQCFRLDNETIVVLYNDGIEPYIAEKEKEFSRAALILGIPTAISYDVVSFGTRTGVIYGMLDAELFSHLIR